MQAVLPAQPEQKVVVWAMDETRLGLHTVRRRRITARGTKPVGVHQQRFKNFYLYGAVAPLTGASSFMVAPKMTATVFEVFLERFSEQNGETFNVVLLDNSTTHLAEGVVIPANVALVFQPPYAPEVNPAERVWQALKQMLAWARFETLDALQERVVALVKEWQAETLRSLTAYPYIISTINAACP